MTGNPYQAPESMPRRPPTPIWRRWWFIAIAFITLLLGTGRAIRVARLAAMKAENDRRLDDSERLKRRDAFQRRDAN